MRRLLAMLLLPLTSLAQPMGVITGKVNDRVTGESLPGVNVVRKNTGTVSDASGHYTLKLEPGTHSLLFRMVGYKSQSKNVVVRSGDTIRLNVALEPDIIEIEQVVVTASRIEQKAAELTVSMSVIKPSAVGGRHISNAQELMNKAPGLEILDGQASMRGGSGFAYGAGSRVLALLDGLPIISADAGNIRWQFLPLDNISQVEIIKGASSVAYGSAALNGVINFRTADATNIPQTRAYAETGLYDSPRNKAWKWWTGPRLTSTAGFNHLRKSGGTDIGFGLNALTDPGYRKRNDDNALRLNLKLKHFDKTIDGLRYGVALNGGFTRKTDFVLWENASTGALIHDSSTAIQLQSSFFALDPFVSYNPNEQTRHDLRARLQRSDNRFPKSAQNNSEAWVAYAEYQYWQQLFRGLELSAGASVNAGIVESNFYGDHNSLNAGVYAQVQGEPDPNLKLVAGMRLEHNRLDGAADSNAFLVPLFRAGINYRLGKFTYLRASFGQGYRFPSIAEKYASTTLGSVKIFPNPFIQSEKGWNAELGLRQGLAFGGYQGQADLAAFLTRNRNMVEFIFGIYPDPVTGVFGTGFRADNLEASRVAGIETELLLANNQSRIGHTLTLNYVLLNPQELNPETGQPNGFKLKYRRTHTLKVGLDGRLGKWSAGTDVIIRSKMLRVDDVFLQSIQGQYILPGFPEYWQAHNTAHMVADLRLAYALTENISISAVVKNISNTEYMGRPGDIQPPRWFSLRLSGSW
ncbi:MAG: TonB-dependent receptor [Bacteroidetes bacterium]|nr:TonB-dependent receptor [Bacteroidota bacterium]